ncbi:nuclear protein DGCR14 [Desarmillaria tabescens]|uniref:Nuclear protein DGCR14 n=1 Tax=Armillaria tabescens TaxID=1929756 RepID=A0AA39NGG1_ARMTA|nr:nuclear protein DGCR14 [Desarmillaria tabescens]KAK0465190.1 nuclear protein DGCR14 [Desarmillaria tabescens]
MSGSQPERSLNHQVVLEEDEYTAALSHIIARDFFPSLAHLDATNEYLDALDTRDPHLITASVRRIEELNATPAPTRRRQVAPNQTPSQTPYGFGNAPFDTPLRTPSNSTVRGEPPQKRPRYDTSVSLDTFQARYTSEDNSSFTQILDSENQARKERWGWAWDAQKRVEGHKLRVEAAREQMLLEGPSESSSRPGVREKVMIEPAKPPAGLITNGDEDEDKKTSDKNEKRKELALQESAEGQQASVTDVMAPRKDTRPAGVDGWNFKARNSLMFPPDADESPYHKPAQAEIKSTEDPKVVVYSSTRLQDDSSSASRGLSAPPSPTRSRIDAAIKGTPYRPRSPTINNFSLVPNFPSPTPSELGPAAVKELMTWGTLSATPRIISQSDDPADLPPPTTPFHLPAPSARERISQKLSNDASKSLRAKAGLLGLSRTPGGPSQTPMGKKGTMLPPSWTPRRSEAAGNLTPAAKRLLDRTTMGTVASRRAEAMEKAAGWSAGQKDISKVRWTPTPNSGVRR